MAEGLVRVLTAAAVSFGSMSVVNGQPKAVDLKSPDGNVKVAVFVKEASRLCYAVTFKGRPVIEDSAMGIIVDEVDLGHGVDIGRGTEDSFKQTWPCRGVHAVAVNHYNSAEISITHKKSKTTYSLEVRAYNDGVAYRYEIPGDGERKINGESSSWCFPDGCTIWYQGYTPQYEDIYKYAELKNLPTGTVANPPFTLRFVEGNFYAAVTEGNLVGYSGMSLKMAAPGVFRANFHDNAEGWKNVGAITTPWRLTIISADLNGLVNSDLVQNVCPPPPAELSDADWIKPGRSVWQWWSSGSPKLDEQHWWIDKTSELGFEYYLIDDGWRVWQKQNKGPWENLAEVVTYAESQGVKILLWTNNKYLQEPVNRWAFLAQAKQIGVAGMKIDFMDSESKKMIDRYEQTLGDAAKLKLTVNFHGANKPTGRNRTCPHEITREGVRGLEYNKWSALPPHHYATLPFTRLLAGDADFTPCTFNPRMLKDTTFALQLATAIVYTSSIIHWADKPDLYLNSPAVEIIRRIPSVWDETVVLTGSKIGELAAFARRRDTTWFVGIINGGSEQKYDLDLSFLEKGDYEAILVRDRMDNPAAMTVEKDNVSRNKRLTVRMREGGGFVGWFLKKQHS